MKCNRKKYNYMEPVLHKIHKNYISLPNMDVKRNNGIMKQILRKLIKKMKYVDTLFDTCFTEVFYGGSFYDGLKVGKPDEFDLDFLLRLPKKAKPVLNISNIPGFVQVQLTNFKNFQKTPEFRNQWSGLAKLVDNQNFLITSKVSQWIRGVIDKVFKRFPRYRNQEHVRCFRANGMLFKGTLHEAGPAQTLKLKMCGAEKNSEVKIDIDLVPCFKFSSNHWPPSPFRRNPIKNKSNFFIVPKKPHREQTIDRYWRLSFQIQERDLIKDKYTLKPTLRLLKKLQANMDQGIIASYHIKTIFLWEDEKSNGDLWRGSQSFAFVTMLKKYKEYIENGKIPYYWSKRNDHLENISDTPLQNLANALQRIINAIENSPRDPYTIAQYLLNPKELAQFTKKFCF